MEYSIVIRTVGKAGEKYQRLLDSIKNLTLQPKEIIVVLPEGYALPPEKLGYEKFVFSKRGMLEQRIYGGEIAESEYLLFLDDDVEFEPDFIQKMVKPIEEGLCHVTFPPQLWMLPPKKGMRKWVPAITASAVPTVFNKDHYTKILKSGGWSYNHYDESKMTGYLKAESAAGICCFCKKQDFLEINFREDKWLEDTDYALYDDQVMFYKFHLYGFNIFCVTEAKFTHLDAGSSSPERAVKAAFANSRNKTIVWYLYVLKQQKNAWGRLCARIAFTYSMTTLRFFNFLSSFRNKNKKAEARAFKAGYKDGKKYIKNLKKKNK
ncbi:MAG: glycosyltransferase [Clostridia bacterium]|nr:glycosyltransferase [Clostridia bacterium]